MNKRSCVIYDSWADQIINLPPEMAGEYAQAILKYAIYGEDVQTDNPAINAMLVPVKKKLDEDADSYEETKKQRAEAGKKGMQSRWSDNKTITKDNKAITKDNGVITNDNTVKQDITNITVSVSDTDTDINNKYILSCKQIIDYLNQVLGTHYKATAKATIKIIKARLNEGHTVDDFKTVIDKKHKTWGKDPKMAEYLRPETLFSASHFESYLNELTARDSPYMKRKIDYEALQKEALSG